MPRHTAELSFVEQERQKPGNRTGVGWVRCLNSNDAWVQGEAEQRAQVRAEAHPCAPGSGVLANLLDPEWSGEGAGRLTCGSWHIWAEPSGRRWFGPPGLQVRSDLTAPGGTLCSQLSASELVASSRLVSTRPASQSPRLRRRGECPPPPSLAPSQRQRASRGPRHQLWGVQGAEGSETGGGSGALSA